MNQEELNQKFMLLEQQIRQLQEQSSAVDQAIMDMTQINYGLDELVGKEGEEIMAPIGRGIFVNAKLLSENLQVDVGGKHFVKKSIPDTKELIGDQIKKLSAMKNDLDGQLESVNKQITDVMVEYQASQKQ